MKAHQPIEMGNRVYKRRVDQVREVLKAGDATAQQVADRIFLTKNWIGHFLLSLERDGMIHVCDHTRGEIGRPKKIYRWGKGQRAPQPGRKPYFSKRRHKQLMAGFPAATRPQPKEQSCFISA